MPEKPTAELPEAHLEAKSERDELVTVAQDVLEGLRNPNYSTVEIYEAYVDDEEDKDKRQLAEMLINAGFMVGIKAEIEEIERTHERPNAVPKYKPLKAACAGFNGQLRDFADAHQHLIGRVPLTEWLEQASGDPELTGRTMAGVTAEIVAKNRLQTEPEVDKVRFSSVREDLEGIDLVTRLHDGRTWKLDIKAGENVPFRFKPDNKAVVPIPLDQLTGFRFSKDYTGRPFDALFR